MGSRTHMFRPVSWSSLYSTKRKSSPATCSTSIWEHSLRDIFFALVPNNRDNFRAKNYSKHALQKQKLFPGEIEREKAMIKAAAIKWFPFGYGPATGTKFEILEIAEVDDYEEDYGEYQGQCRAVATEVRGWQEVNKKHGNWFDGNQKARRTGQG